MFTCFSSVMQLLHDNLPYPNHSHRTICIFSVGIRTLTPAEKKKSGPSFDDPLLPACRRNHFLLYPVYIVMTKPNTVSHAKNLCHFIYCLLFRLLSSAIAAVSSAFTVSPQCT